MSVTLLRSYMGTPAGTTVEYTQELEAALVAQGLASTATANTATSGPLTQNSFFGTAVIPAGSSSVVITNANITANSVVHGCVSQAAADGTLLRIERIVPAAGSVTLYGTANATAATTVTWAVITGPGFTPAQ